MNDIRKMLEEYTGRDLSPWHMPGHKRKPVFPGMWTELFRFDVTEVPGTDDLHHAMDAIARSQEGAADAVGAAYSHYLVGGSTAGILASIAAMTKRWRKRTGREQEAPVFLAASNCHKSVWNGLRLVGAKVVTVVPAEDPVYGPVLTDELLRVISEEVEDTEAVAGCILTSPTYAGVVSPLGELHAVLEVYGIPLLVDEAHGAHLPFWEDTECRSAVECGAEYVVQSLHKTLPALTQTAILHVSCDLDEEAVAEELAVFQSSSPSYLLMLSAEQAVDWADRNRDRFPDYMEEMQRLREELQKELKQLEVVSLPGAQDPSRIMLRAKESMGSEPFTGTMMADWLERETGIVAELAGSRELILLSSVCDEKEDLQRLKDALLQLDREIRRAWDRAKRSAARKAKRKAANGTGGVQEKTAGNGSGASTGIAAGGSGPSDLNVTADRGLSAGTTEGVGSAGGIVRLPRVGDFVQRDIYVYPPGVPILRGGERVTEAALQRMKEEQEAGRRIYGL